VAAVIEFENISKQYRLGKIGTGTISHDLNRWWHTVRGKEDPYLKIGQINDRTQVARDGDYVWALRDISLSVEQGDVLGIIGKNGAGKSTLLKILSKITTPTTGIIKARGRIASLLEVGTGFHPEMTGRENIYLNGTILGMTKAEITRKFDEIVDFAGVAKYIDTPAKRYSSGMEVRLGFAIAAHLDPEILVVDEVLAVGDAEFQKKAIGKMQDVSKREGRTVLFVSHNLESVKTLCNRGILLKDGCIQLAGETNDVVNTYIEETYTKNQKIYFDDITDAIGNENIKIKSFEVYPAKGNALNVESGICFKLQFYNHKSNIMLDANVELLTADNVVVFFTGAMLSSEKDSKRGIYEVSFSLPPYLLNAGKYKMSLFFGENQRHVLWYCIDVLWFEIENTLTPGYEYNIGTFPGIIKPQIKFQSVFLG